MRCVVLYNPIAGRGKSAMAANKVAAHLENAGHSCRSIQTQIGPANPELVETLNDQAELLIVLGGDGSMRQAAAFAIETDTPIYQYPLGTENLFAREFQMDRSLETLDRAIAKNQTQPIDVGMVNGQLFLLMVSLGFDAEVVHDLAAKRTGAISRLTYLRPIVRQFCSWQPRDYSITADDHLLELPGPGMMVIANSRQYGFRFDPLPHASMTDGKFDLAYFPMLSRRQLTAAIIRARLGKHRIGKTVIHYTCKRIRIECDDPQRFQMDGDAAMIVDGAEPEAMTTPLDISLHEKRLFVLLP